MSGLKPSGHASVQYKAAHTAISSGLHQRSPPHPIARSLMYNSAGQFHVESKMVGCETSDPWIEMAAGFTTQREISLQDGA